MTVPPLPEARSNQAYCSVSALEGGQIRMPCLLMVSTASPNETLTAPALSFLLTHSGSGAHMLLDFGIRKDVENTRPPSSAERARTVFSASAPEDVLEALAKGGLTPDGVE